jgi:hypothetical protein
MPSLCGIHPALRCAWALGTMDTLRKAFSRILFGEHGARFDAALAAARASRIHEVTIAPLELSAAIRALAARTPDIADELAGLEAELFVLGQRVQVSKLEVEEYFWHYLSDADLRHRDHDVATEQRRDILAWADDWDRQHGA